MRCRVCVVAEPWFRDLDESDRALRTKLTYRDAWRRSVEPAVGQLRLSDMRVPTVDRVIRQRRGSSPAHHAKVVLSGILGLAVRHDRIEANPVRELTPARRRPAREKVALTESGLTRLREHLAGSNDAQRFDLVDLVDVPSGLGCRIGELLALDRPRIDERAGTIAIEGTVDPGAGGGASSCSRTPSPRRACGRSPRPGGFWTCCAAGTPTRTAPGCSRRPPAAARPGQHPRAASAGRRGYRVGGTAPARVPPPRRDPARRGGPVGREVADYLGHGRVSMTQDVYMARRVAGAAAATAMESFGDRVNRTYSVNRSPS